MLIVMLDGPCFGLKGFQRCVITVHYTTSFPPFGERCEISNSVRASTGSGRCGSATLPASGGELEVFYCTH